MKMLLLFFFLIPIFSQAQVCVKEKIIRQNPLYNEVAVCFQLNDLGIGVRYDRFFKLFGVYGSVTHGKYVYIEEHTKAAVGITTKIFEDVTYMSFGVVRHFNKGVSEDPWFDRKALWKWTGEVGAGVLLKRINVSFTYELFLVNSSINIGYRF
jgi:hypothetical protein